MPILHKMPETEDKGILHTHYKETSISLITEVDKDITRKANYRAISFMIRDVKILDKVLTSILVLNNTP